MKREIELIRNAAAVMLLAATLAVLVWMALPH